MAQNKLNARRKKLTELWNETRITLLRSCSFLTARALVAKLKAQAKSSYEQLGIVSLTLQFGLATIVESVSGIAIFFSDGSALFAPRTV